MRPEALKKLAVEALDDLKGKEIVAIEVSHLTGLMDYVIICTGTSSRRLASLECQAAIADSLSAFPHCSRTASHPATCSPTRCCAAQVGMVGAVSRTVGLWMHG